MSETELNTSRKKILVADDEADLREALFTVLAAAGYEVLVANNGEEALAIAEKEQPDIALLDLMMPVLGGKEVLKKIRASDWGKNMKILILTAVSDLESLSEILDEGGTDYLVKSDWQLSDIVKKVEEKLYNGPKL